MIREKPPGPQTSGKISKILDKDPYYERFSGGIYPNGSRCGAGKPARILPYDWAGLLRQVAAILP